MATTISFENHLDSSVKVEPHELQKTSETSLELKLNQLNPSSEEFREDFKSDASPQWIRRHGYAIFAPGSPCSPFSQPMHSSFKHEKSFEIDLNEQKSDHAFIKSKRPDYKFKERGKRSKPKQKIDNCSLNNADGNHHNINNNNNKQNLNRDSTKASICDRELIPKSSDLKEDTKLLKSLIVVDKPHGITSMTVIRILRRVLKPLKITKVGYAGTLDPFATGVLVVGIGREGTRQLGTLSDKDKRYECEVDLLKDTYSGDMDGFKDVDQKELVGVAPSLEQILKLINDKFTGEIKQIPPTLSAIKINGKKACDLVRQNVDVVMKERTVKIYKIDVLNYEFPILKLDVSCSKGTYIRSLGRDIGKELNLYGSLISLRRIGSGEHSLKDALELDKITLGDLMLDDK